MSCMNLAKTLQPAKKAWKIFTTTLHTKLRKLNTSKSTKKSKTHVKTTSKASSSTVYRSHVHHQRKRIHKAHFLRTRTLTKRSAPVYIDELFNDPVVTGKALIKEKGSTSALLDPYARDCPGKREKVEGNKGETSGADDMWESLQLASPLMHGINERADEFIAKVKAEMHLQETIARRL